MRILITGGSGFVGRHFCTALRRLGHACHVYDLHPPAFEEVDQFTWGDVRDGVQLQQAMDGVDAVLHLAAAHHDFGITRETYFAVNAGGAEQICEAMRKTGVENLCFFSTVAVYGQARPPLDETTEPQPESDYGRSKLAAEHIFYRWSTATSGRCLIVRPTITFGPHNFANMFTLIRQIDARRFLPVGTGENIKSLAYVENLVAATVYAWLEYPARFERCDVFNYVDKPDMTSAQIIRAIYEELGRGLPPMNLPYWTARMLALPFDAAIAVTGANLPISSARLKKLAASETRYEANKILEAGFRPPVPLREGIARMVAWYRDRGQDKIPAARIPPPMVPAMVGSR